MENLLIVDNHSLSCVLIQIFYSHVVTFEKALAGAIVEGECIIGCLAIQVVFDGYISALLTLILYPLSSGCFHR